jgi:hypothetical protein
MHFSALQRKLTSKRNQFWKSRLNYIRRNRQLMDWWIQRGARLLNWSIRHLWSSMWDIKVDRKLFPSKFGERFRHFGCSLCLEVIWIIAKVLYTKCVTLTRIIVLEDKTKLWRGCQELSSSKLLTSVGKHLWSSKIGSYSSQYIQQGSWNSQSSISTGSNAKSESPTTTSTPIASPKTNPFQKMTPTSKKCSTLKNSD